MGWSWINVHDWLYTPEDKEIKYLDKHGYTNTQYNKEDTGINLMHFSRTDDYPETSFTELMILANMESLPEVAQYLDANELKKYNIEQEDSMKSDEFTKDMLKDGMFVLMRDQEDEYSKGYSIVLGKGFVNEEGYVSIDYYDDDLLYRDDESFDIVEVFTSEKLTWWKEESFKKQLTSIWKRQSPEEQQRTEKKAELEKAILDAEEKIKVAKEALKSL